MKKGFTLIELLVVVLIIGILSAVAWPNYQVAVERARITKALPLLRSIRDAQMRYQMATSKQTASLEALDISIPYTNKLTHNEGYTYTDTPVGAITIVPSAIFYTTHYVVLDYYGRDSAHTEIGILRTPSAWGSVSVAVLVLKRSVLVMPVRRSMNCSFKNPASAGF